MRLLFVADGRSPIAINWIRHFVEAGHEVHLASTFACEPGLPLRSFHTVSVAFSGVKPAASGQSALGKVGIWGATTVGLRTRLRQWLGPLTLSRASAHLRQVIAQVEPDLVHAMRIPYEGMVTALADPGAPFVLSVWGNDFTLHAAANPLMRRYTRLALRRADGLHTDCQRDVRLAHSWGFDAGKPSTVLPGGGGVQLSMFSFGPEKIRQFEGRDSGQDLSFQESLVINPRGVRSYVCNEAFFRSIPLILERRGDVRFVCPAMAGEARAEGWVRQLGIEGKVMLLPLQSRAQMAELFRQAWIVVSPSLHDGTPNTLLEAMACGCFPVAGDIESLREWIQPGMNGLLVNPRYPRELAEAVLIGLSQPGLLVDAAQRNVQLIRERAEYGRVMTAAENFYADFLTRGKA